MTKILQSDNCEYEISFSDAEFTPYRKKPTMAIRKGNTSTKVATFNNQESFEWFLRIVTGMFDDEKQIYSITDEPTRLYGVAKGVEVGANADWNATEGDTQILNKPLICSRPLSNG